MKSNKARIGTALAAATGSLLSHTPRDAIAAEPWTVDASIFVYSEDDSRVSDVSFKSLASRVLGDEDSFTVGLQVDSLTGATPTGAVPLNQPQTFTRPSGNGQYEVAANELPLDDTFRDTRLQLNATRLKTLDNTDRFTYGGSFSREFDYTHLGVNTGIARDINNRNTTLSAAIALSLDQSDPVGGSPEPLSDVIASSLNAVSEEQINGGAPKGGTETKSIVDLVFGTTQVINRRSLIQFNYSLSFANGYLNDPYKFLTVVDPLTGASVAGASGGSLLYLSESRPDSRVGHNLFAAYKYHFDSGIADLSYRYHADDWGINSHTLEGRYRYDVTDTVVVEPHLRYYTQSAADFYRAFLTTDNTDIAFASADYRLGDFDAVTVGIKLSREWASGSVLSARFERYQTDGDDNTDLPGVDARYPDTGAFIAQLNYRFRW